MSKPYDPLDFFARRAKIDGFRARSVYKLKELDKKFYLLKPDQKVLDIGAYPGSWLQFIIQRVGPQGLAVGVDLQPIKPIAANIKTYVADISEPNQLIANLLVYSPFDLILSDLSPNTSGIKEVDHLKSIQLNQAVFSLAKQYLKTGGNLVMKLFPGREFESFIIELKRSFQAVQQARVNASRKTSNEVYLVCLNKR